MSIRFWTALLGGVLATASSVTLAAPSLSFSAHAEIVNRGSEAGLAWTATEATSCMASGSWSGTKAASGFERVGPLTARSRYFLECSGPNGTARQKVDINVAAGMAPPVIVFSADAVSLTAGQTTVLRWNAYNATICRAEGAWSGSRALSGAQTTSPINANTTYQLTCDGPGGSRFVALSLALGKTLPQVWVRAVVGPTALDPAKYAHLEWASSNSTSCSFIVDGVGSFRGPAGTDSQQLSGLAQQFAFACTGAGGTTTATVSIAALGVNQRPIAREDVFTTTEDKADPIIEFLSPNDLLVNDRDPDGAVRKAGAFSTLYYTSSMQFAFATTLEGLIFVEADDVGRAGFIVPLRDATGRFPLVGYHAVDNVGEESLAESAEGVISDDFTPVTVNILAVDEQPLPQPDVATTLKDQSIWIDLTRNDRQLDRIEDSWGGWFYVTFPVVPAHGVITNKIWSSSNYTIQYQPAPGFVGTDSFQYRVQDKQGDVGTGTVTVHVLSQPCIADGSYGAPLAGTANVDWFATQFVDRDAATGFAIDFMGGSLTRDGSTTSRFVLKDLVAMQQLVPVRAMQCGTVVEVFAGQVDYSAVYPGAFAYQQCSNHVVIRQSSGRTDTYCNLKLYGANLYVGAAVAEGETVGYVGVSGGQYAPGVSVETREANGTVVDIFALAGTFDPGYLTTPRLVASGVTADTDLRLEPGAWLIAPRTLSSIASTEIPLFWAKLVGVRVGTEVLGRLLNEDGSDRERLSKVIVANDFSTLSRPLYDFRFPAKWKLPPGIYRFALQIDGGSAIESSFSVTAPNGPPATPASLTVPTADSDGSYAVSWAASVTTGVTYVLEEATNALFTAGLRTAYTGTALSAAISGRSSGVTYYYRLKATLSGYADSAWVNAGNGCLVTIPPASAVTLTPSVASPATIGASVTFNAAASGGSGSYQYKFLLRAPGGTLNTARDYSSAASWSWNTTGLVAGSYQVVVYARNVGSTKNYETYRSLSYGLATPASAVTLTPSVASPAKIGTMVTFNSVASGGSGKYQYRYYLRAPGGALNLVRDYSATASWSWNTSGLAVGTYQVVVYARNVGSTKSYETYKSLSYSLTAQ